MADALAFETFLEEKGLSPTKWLPLLTLLDIESPADLKQLRLEQYNKLIKAAKATDDEKAILHEIVGPSLELCQELEEVGLENASYWLPLLHKHGVYSCQSLTQLDPAKYHDLEPLAVHVGEKQALKRLFRKCKPSQTSKSLAEHQENVFGLSPQFHLYTHEDEGVALSETSVQETLLPNTVCTADCETAQVKSKTDFQSSSQAITVELHRPSQTSQSPDHEKKHPAKQQENASGLLPHLKQQDEDVTIPETSVLEQRKTHTVGTPDFENQELGSKAITVDVKQQKDAKEIVSQKMESSVDYNVVSRKHKSFSRGRKVLRRLLTQSSSAAKITDEKKSDPISKEEFSIKYGSEVQDQSCAKFDDLIHSLALDEYYPQRLKKKDSTVVRSVAIEPLHESKKIPFVVLQKLMMVNFEYRSSLSMAPKREIKELELGDGTVHPMDALLALVHCSDNFLRQIIFSKLATCQLAVPFLLPDPKKGTVTLLLWAMRSIVKAWYSKPGPKEERIIECKAPIMSFMRYGEISNISKSELINYIMFKDNNDTFCNWNLVKGEPLRIAVDGLVDMSWYLPSDNQEKNLFPCAVSIANLHGDCSVHTKQMDFLAKCSFTNVVLVNSLDVLSDDGINTFRKLSQVPGGLVLLSCEQSEEMKAKGIAYTEITLYSRHGKKKSFESVKDEFINVILKKDLTKSNRSITECAALAKKFDIVIDEETEQCQHGRELALDHIGHFKSKENDKDELFPLQGKKLWRQWARENKELHRIPGDTSNEIEKYKQEKRKAKKEIRLQQWRKLVLVPLLVSKFHSNILCLESGKEAESYYLYWINLFLDDHSRDILQELYPQYQLEKRKKSSSKQKAKVQEIVCKMIAASIGLEHFLREFGQMYETAQMIDLNKDNPSADTLVVQLPKIAAKFLLSGYPFEIMDGDASHVPITWVSAVLEEVTRQLHNPKVLVVSVLGVQSTGKSTLLNTVFGLQFSVSAGRCTRGVFMQMVSLDRELSKKMNYSHMLVIDTEGLRAPELSTEMSNVHDNEIATFVIGIADVTIINQFGETFAEMDNILQTVVHALLRMKQVKKNSKVVFVHQNVPGLLAREKGDHGRLNFKQMLDEMTLLAAKEERCESKYKSFNDVIKFRDDEDVFNFPSLWKGDPPMAPVNPGYSDKALKLKSHVLKTPSHYSMCSFIKHLNGVWGSILYEDFVFSFKNTLEVAAYSSLEKALSQWQWKLQKEMLAWERKTKYLFETCDFAEKAQKDLKQNQLLIVKKLNKQWDSEINHEKIKFFGGEYKETLVQWKAKTDNRLKELQKEKYEDAERFCGIQYSYRAGREDVKRRQISYQEMILDLIKELLKQLEKQLTSEELRSHFDEEWKKWMEGIPSICSCESETNIKKRIEDRMKAKLFSEKNVFARRGGLIPVTEVTLEVQPYHIDENNCTDFFNTVLSFIGIGPYEKLLNKAKEESELIVGKAVSFIKEMENEGNNCFSTNVIDQMLNVVLEAVDKSEVKFTREYEVDLTCMICGYALHTYEALIEKARKKYDPKLYFMENKETHFSILETKYAKLAQSKQAAIVLCSLLKESMCSLVNDSLPQQVVDSMKSSSCNFHTKKSLKVIILTDLAEKEDLDLFFEYFKDAKASIQYWIMRYIQKHCDSTDVDQQVSWINKEISGLFQQSKDHIIDVVKRNSPKSSFKSWLGEFHSKMEGYIPLSLDNVLSLTKDFVVDEDNIKEFEIEFVDCLKKMNCDVKKIKDCKPWEERAFSLFTNLIGCCEQCPFCAEQCDLMFPDHESDGVDHSVELHRPRCLGMYRWIKSQEIVLDICSTGVASESTFQNKDTEYEPHPYKEYRDIYPKWKITPDLSISASSYWKWFVCKYSSEIAKRYDAMETDIPESWKEITKEQVLTDIKKIDTSTS